MNIAAIQRGQRPGISDRIIITPAHDGSTIHSRLRASVASAAKMICVMHRRDLFRSVAATTLAASLPSHGEPTPAQPASDRAFWLGHIDRIAKPVLEALADNRLRDSMPIEAKPEMLASRTWEAVSLVALVRDPDGRTVELLQCGRTEAASARA